MRENDQELENIFHKKDRNCEYCNSDLFHFKFLEGIRFLDFWT